MRFDKTFIAIRERNTLELLDLTMHVIRYHFWPLMVLFCIGVLPWLLIDCWLTGWMVSEANFLDYTFMFYFVMAMLVVSQAQIGTTFLTCYLGHAMFVGRPGIKETIRNTFKTSKIYFLWVHLLFRTVALVLFNAFFLSADNLGNGSNEMLMGVLMPGLVIIGLIVRMLRPFASEMLLLEKTPVRAKPGSKTIDFKTRSSSLHGAVAGDAFSRFMVSVIFAVPLAYVFYSALCWVDGILNLQGAATRNFNFIYWPVSLWVTAAVVAVFRFLSYIDTRIRQEGWAVELKMRAEALNLSS